MRCYIRGGGFKWGDISGEGVYNGMIYMYPGRGFITG